MKWPWQKAAENRGTLTFFEGGAVVLGVPHGMTDERAAQAYGMLRSWLDRQDERRPLVLPFPVDIDDRRNKVARR